jgi:cytochrome c peroxidase
MLHKSGLVLLGIALLVIAVPAQAQLTPMEQLGKALFFDKISSPDNMSCAECHAPSVGWTGPLPGINLGGAVYRGAVPQRFGNRKPPSSGYATLSPNFHWDAAEELFVGGNFWDGRATGDHLGNPAADQALGPFLNPVEQNNPSKLAVLEQIAAANYAPLWEVVWGAPLAYSTPAEIDMNYDRVGLAIAAYEGSSEVNAFTSKFDLYMNGQVELTAEELWGMELFEGKGLCSACHPAPLFTDFTFDNLGVFKNPDNPFYRMDTVYLDDGTPINPEGDDWIDPGLGGFLASLPESYFTNLGLDKATAVAENWGKHKVPTLRNVDLRPGRNFPKAFMHNGALKSLKEVVHFYNTRDVAPWPPPEVLENMNTDELGNLGLTDAEEDAIVAFMQTLSDGWRPVGRRGSHGTIASVMPARLDIVRATPFDPQTRLVYAVPQAGPVRVVVYDVSGKKVATLVDDWRTPGEHSVDWSAKDVASGSYLVLFDSGTNRVARKLQILK